MNSHLRCSKTLWQTLNAADVVGVNVVAVIWACGGEGHIINDDLADISEIGAVGRSAYVQKKRFKTLVSKRPRVEIPRLERGLSEPKSLVLPLHHTSIQLGKDRIIFLYHQT